MRFILFLLLSLLASTVYATNPAVIVQQNPVIVKRHITEFDANSYLGLQGYYSVMDRAKIELAQNHELDRKALSDLTTIVKTLLERQNCQPMSQPTIPQPPVEQPPAPQPAQNQGLTGSDLDKKVYAIFTKNCASCHSDTKTSGGLKLVTANGLYDLSAKQRFNIHFRTFGVNLKTFNKALMPLNGNSLSDADVSTLYDWACAKLLQELNQ